MPVMLIARFDGDVRELSEAYVPQPLVVEDQPTDRTLELLALPLALDRPACCSCLGAPARDLAGISRRAELRARTWEATTAMTSGRIGSSLRASFRRRCCSGL